MTKRKRQQPTVEEILERPWCYYCERDFDDLKILISHQKAKHYKCEQCGRRLNTAGGLSVHMSQVHKETLTTIENALPNRADVGVEIFGMEGVPAEILEAHKQRVTNEYFKRVAERRAETGNPPPGTAPAGQKRTKTEAADDIKKRLAEHKAKREAAKLAASTGELNDGHMEDVMTPEEPETRHINVYLPFPPCSSHEANLALPQAFDARSAQNTPVQQGYMPPVGMPPSHMSPSSMPPAPGFFPGMMPPQHMGMPYGAHPPPMPYGGQPPPMPPADWAQIHHLPPQRQHHQGSPQSPYPPSHFAGSPPLPANLPRTPIDTSFRQSGSEVPSMLPQLPARPAIDAPNLSKEDMARMHAGAAPVPAQSGVQGLPPNPMSSSLPSHNSASPGLPGGPPYGLPSAPQAPYNSLSHEQQGLRDSVDDFIKSIIDEAEKKKGSTSVETQQTPNGQATEISSTLPLAADPTLPNPPDTPERTQVANSVAEIQLSSKPDTPTQEATRSKKSSKKSKDADHKAKLVYSDTLVSPEEKKAASSRYVFKRDDSTSYTLGNVGPAVTGPVRGSDDVLDTQAAH